MNLIIVSFDLDTKDKEFSSSIYHRIEEKLTQLFGGFVKPIDNTYIVRNISNFACTHIREELKIILSVNDTIFVAGLDGNYASWNYPSINEKLSNIFKGGAVR